MMVVRAIKNPDGTYFLINTQNEMSKPIPSQEVKQMMLQKKIVAIDLQIDKSNRLVPKKVDYLRFCRDATGQNPLTVKEQERILFYGLARVNQLTYQKQQKYINKIKEMNTIDEADLVSIFTENVVWDFNKYKGLDTQCRDKVIDILYSVAGKRNAFTC